MGPQEGVVELVVFKLKEGASGDELLGTADAVSAWIATQPGFVARELLHDAGGERWIDIVRWRSMDDAHAAAELAMSSDSCAPMFSLIDMDSMLMAHGEPRHAAAAR